MDNFEGWDETSLPEPDRERLAITQHLLADVFRVKSLLAANPSDGFARRLLVRAVFTMIEGAIFAMKSDILLYEKGLSVEQVAVLSESSFEIDDSGRVKTRPSFMKLPPNLKFAFTTFAGCHGINFNVPTGGDGWRAFIESQKVRNRLTHPKKFTDLIVSDKEVKASDATCEWFVGLSLDLYTACQAMKEAKLLSNSDDRDIQIIYDDCLESIKERARKRISDKSNNSLG